ISNITWHYMSLMDNAKREETRKKLIVEHDNLARAENIPLLEKILPLRDDIARKLGYKTWADYQIQIQIWDWRYFSNQLKKEKYNVDAEQLRVYFPYQRVLDGMFNIYQTIFGLK